MPETTFSVTPKTENGPPPIENGPYIRSTPRPLLLALPGSHPLRAHAESEEHVQVHGTLRGFVIHSRDGVKRGLEVGEFRKNYRPAWLPSPGEIRAVERRHEQNP